MYCRAWTVEYGHMDVWTHVRSKFNVNRAKVSPKTANLASNWRHVGAKLVQVGSNWFQVEAKFDEVGPKLVQGRPKLARVGIK